MSPEKRARQRAVKEIVAREPIGSQAELAQRLSSRGYEVTQATVSRDVAELGLVKLPRPAGYAYVSPEDLAAPPDPPSDERLRRILSDVPVTVGRSGLVVVLTGSPGTASVVAQAIDESTLHEQEGTLAGDNTLLVLFANEVRLERWLARFREIQATSPTAASSSILPSAPTTPTEVTS